MATNTRTYPAGVVLAVVAVAAKSIALLDRTSGYIEWRCPLCGDNGLIHRWEDIPWDRQHDTRGVPTIPSPPTAH
jgi:hypothetical protein